MSWVRELDPRQRAMLDEMGVKVWAPMPVATPAPVPGMAAAPVAPPSPSPVSAPARSLAPAAAPTVASAPSTPPARPVDTAALAHLGWDDLRQTVAACQACGLCTSRRQTVFGAGQEQARWMIVGEAPGEQEDRQGEPFVGPAGQLLDAMLRATGRDRRTDASGGVYIANVLKCRPPANRNPAPDEVLRCEPFLARQVALVQPKLIVAMGRFAVQSLLRTTEPIGKLRGRVHRYEGVPVIVTYHPAYLLRNPADKAKAWADLCLALDQPLD
ncbi:uracil-DNA glycosylase [Hydrogenophaga sp. R2]|uniref:uracil-DNA glycosylase n=1 Tax=Hydrogenophaga sp. R2 TaxID=3132827 RepID=UPI003CEF7A6C